MKLSDVPSSTPAHIFFVCNNLNRSEFKTEYLEDSLISEFARGDLNQYEIIEIYEIG